MMRRSLLQLIALLAVLGLIAAACSDDGDTTDTTVDPAPTDDPADEPDESDDEPDEPVDEPDEPVEPELDYAVHSVPADYDTIQAAVDCVPKPDAFIRDICERASDFSSAAFWRDLTTPRVERSSLRAAVARTFS